MWYRGYFFCQVYLKFVKLGVRIMSWHLTCRVKRFWCEQLFVKVLLTNDQFECFVFFG